MCVANVKVNRNWKKTTIQIDFKPKFFLQNYLLSSTRALFAIFQTGKYDAVVEKRNFKLKIYTWRVVSSSINSYLNYV